MRFTTAAVFSCAISVSAWAHDYGKLPLSFEANEGQTDARARFLTRGRDETLFLMSNGGLLLSGRSVVGLELSMSNPSARVSGVDELPGKSNYFIGNDPARWRANVRTFARVRYEKVYSGIDLVYYGNQRDLEYDFVVAPGADPRAIRFSINGNGQPRIDGRGDLVLSGGESGLRLHRPVVYQAAAGEIGGRRWIDSKFVIQGRTVGFQIARYDRAKPLIIDPVLSYSTYLGGSQGDTGQAIAVDSSGNAYVTGYTGSSNFPTSKALHGSFGGGTANVFVTKLNAAGSALVYSTYLGGSQYDQGFGIALDSSGNAYVTGNTDSPNFPTTANALQPTIMSAGAFVAKLNPSGSALVYSTYLNVSKASAIAVDAAGNAYIAGSSNGSLPTVSAFQATNGGSGDAFVAKLNPSGSALAYCTYLGGSDGDNATGIAIDAAGEAYITGNTLSSNFPLKNAYQHALAGGEGSGDSFVAKFNAAGTALVFSTYLGGTVDELAGSIAVDSAGNAYVTGSTVSPDFPTTPNAFEAPIASGGAYQGYVSKFGPSGAIIYSTYLGSGFGGAYSYGIVADSAGNAYVTGAASATFPTQDPFQAAPGGVYSNVFVTKLNSAGSALIYSTYLGGTNSDQGYAIALDSATNAYITGSAISTDFPTANAFQAKFGGVGNPSNQGDAFVAKFQAFPAGVSPPSISANGVVNGASFQPGIVSGSWATIQGSNFSSATGTWDVVNGKLPTSVNGVSVTVGGQSAYVYYVSTGQINFIVPEVPAGTQPVIVANSAGSSSAVNATVATYGPAFFGWPNSQAVATRQDFSLAAKNGTFAGTTTVPAKPGDTIILWGTGFGPTVPVAPAGMETPSNATYSTSTLPMVEIDNVSATVYGAALAPGFAGLYQVAIQVPASIGNGDWPIVATIGGVSSPTGMVLTVQQ